MICPNCNCKLLHIDEINSVGQNATSHEYQCHNWKCPSLSAFSILSKSRMLLRTWIHRSDTKSYNMYTIPFKHRNDWYIINGPIDYVNGIGIMEFVRMHYGAKGQEWLDHTNISRLPFHPLPTDETFIPEFNRLKDRLLKLMVLM